MDQYIKQWLYTHLDRDSTIVEAGTSDGTDTEIFSDFLTTGKLYAFEPIPELYNITKSKLSDRTNVILSNLALSDITGVSIINVSDNRGSAWGSSSLLKPKAHLEVYSDITFNNEIEVNTINLDEWYINEKLDIIDFMWLDLQGFEPVVLKNSPKILSKTRYIHTEVALIETYKGVITRDEFTNFLNEAGFVEVWSHMEQYEGNILFKNIKLEELDV
jgi:FkbM family methyltransferase